MIEITSHFVLIRPKLIQEALLLQKITYIPIGAEEFACKSKVSLDQTPQRDDRGDVWMQRFRAVTADCSVRQHDGANRYVGVIMSDGSIRIIGSPGEAPIITVTPGDQGMSVVETTFETTEPLDL